MEKTPTKDWTVTAATNALLTEAEQRKKALEALDLPSLQAAAIQAAYLGLQHFQMSKDTRQPLETRKAHRFVSINCEELVKKILRLSCQTEEELDEMAKEIVQRAVQFNQERVARAKLVATPVGLIGVPQ